MRITHAALLLRILVITLLALCAPTLQGCGETYSQATPEDTIVSARKMIENGDTRQLSNLIYADNPDFRRLLNRLGLFMANLEGLGRSIQTRFPDDVARLKAQAEEAAARGQATSLFGQLSQNLRPQRGGQRSGNRGGARGGRPGPEAEEAFNQALLRLFADPYGWLKESEGRLTTVFLTDNSVALLWDNKPILPPLGLTMRKDAKGDWFFVLPTNFPGAGNFMPDTPEEFKVFGSIIATFDNVVKDLRTDVDSGRITSIEQLSTKAGEKTFIPAAMVFLAFGRLQEAQRREAQTTAPAAAPNATAPAVPSPR